MWNKKEKVSTRRRLAEKFEIFRQSGGKQKGIQEEGGNTFEKER